MACEPLAMLDDDSDDVLMDLSLPVASAVEEAAQLIETMILDEDISNTQTEPTPGHAQSVAAT
jgi:hypothetical protein